MKKFHISIFIFLSFWISASLNAQGTESKSDTIHSLAKKLDMFVFPSENQTAEQQEKDEFDCYKWAVEQSGVDPISPPKVEAEKVETGPDGGAVRGAARGAAAGAAIGAVAGDAGKGAAVGATAGGMRGVRGSAASQQQQQKQAVTEAKAKEEELMNNFKRAFSVCLEGKGYKVSQ